MLATAQPIPNLSDLDGTPLESGSIYYGVAGQNPETSPVTVYWDSAGTQPAAQPIRTMGGYPVRNGAPAHVFVSGNYSITVRDRRGALVLTAPDASKFDQTVIAKAEVDALRADLASTAADNGASLSGVEAELASEVAGTVQRWFENGDYVSVFRFMTDAQIADYKARTAQTSYSTALDLSSPIQTAIYVTYAAGRNLFLPAGAAKIVSAPLELPTNSVNYEDRGDAWKLRGAGASQTFVTSGYKGTVLVSDTDAPILRYRQRRTMPTSGANYEIFGIRFQQISPDCTNPVVQLDSLCEYASFHHNQIFQQGTGDGIKVLAQVKGEICHNFIMNRDWVSGSVSAVGYGINMATGWDSGLLTIRKNTARGFLWGFVIGNGVDDPSATLVEQNECSQCKNGIWVRANVSTCTLFKNYFEGIQDTCVWDDGTMTTVDGCQMYLGFTTGINSPGLTYGNSYKHNYIETGSKANVTLIDVLSSGASGGAAKSVVSNELLFSQSGGSIAGVVGVKVSGVNPRLTMFGNAFEPRGAWIGGAGTMAIQHAETGQGVHGFTTAKNGEREWAHLGQGSISLGRSETTLTQANVSANVLTVGEGSWHQINATSPVSVTSIAGGTESGRLLVLETQSANMTFTDSASLKLAGNASFTGPGILVLLTQIIGATTFASEISRSSL